jgi:hypothetical protein
MYSNIIGEKLLKAMVLRPITNHVEMGITDLDAMATKLSLIADYQNLFVKAYGTPEVTPKASISWKEF